MTGNVAPDIVKPVPVSAAELIVTGAIPAEVRVTGCVDAVFTDTLPNVRLAVLSVNCGLASAVPVPLSVPVPFRLTTAVLLVDELLWIVSWPEAAPVVAGSNCTFSVTDWLGFKVTGNVPPDSVKPVPLTAAELIVTGAVPVEVNVTGCVDAEPTVELPNAKLAALTVKIGVELLVLPPTPWPVIVP